MNYLYQLKTDKEPGQTMRIDGPWDTWGIVIKHQPSGYSLIRGLGHQDPNKHSHSQVLKCK